MGSQQMQAPAKAAKAPAPSASTSRKRSVEGAARKKLQDRASWQRKRAKEKEKIDRLPVVEAEVERLKAECDSLRALLEKQAGKPTPTPTLDHTPAPTSVPSTSRRPLPPPMHPRPPPRETLSTFVRLIQSRLFTPTPFSDSEAAFISLESLLLYHDFIPEGRDGTQWLQAWVDSYDPEQEGVDQDQAAPIDDCDTASEWIAPLDFAQHNAKTAVEVEVVETSEKPKEEPSWSRPSIDPVQRKRLEGSVEAAWDRYEVWHHKNGSIASKAAAPPP